MQAGTAFASGSSTVSGSASQTLRDLSQTCTRTCLDICHMCCFLFFPAILLELFFEMSFLIKRSLKNHVMFSFFLCHSTALSQLSSLTKVLLTKTCSALISHGTTPRWVWVSSGSISLIRDFTPGPSQTDISLGILKYHYASHERLDGTR